MCAAASRSEPKVLPGPGDLVDLGDLVDPTHAAAALASLRVKGGVRAGFHQARGATHITDLAESGGYRLRFPKTHAAHIEATQINTGGGVAGGDRLDFTFAAGLDADVVVATQSAERIYRSNGPPAQTRVRLSLAAGARIDWLPQETILFSGSRLERRFDADLAADSRLLMVEAVTFGRIASGEILGNGSWHDCWRIKRGGRLIFADNTRLEGNIADLMARPAVAAGARSIALLLYVAPDAADRLDAVRAALEPAGSHCAASAWNGMLTARFLAVDAAALRRDVVRATATLTGRPLPRVWQV